jgi:hypothetical protein
MMSAAGGGSYDGDTAILLGRGRFYSTQIGALED